MSRRLTEITDWPVRAAEAQWCVNNLAEACGVSVPQLERHFHETWGQCPRAWLQAERMRRACELLESRERIKDVADKLGYGHQCNFTAAFTKLHGYSPRMRLKKMAEGESRVTKVESRGPKSEIGNRKSEIGNRKSEIGNRKSEIGNRKSEIGTA